MTLRFKGIDVKEPFTSKLINCLRTIDREGYKQEIDDLMKIHNVLNGVDVTSEILLEIGRMQFEFDFDLDEISDTARDMLFDATASIE